MFCLALLCANNNSSGRFPGLENVTLLPYIMARAAQQPRSRRCRRRHAVSQSIHAVSRSRHAVSRSRHGVIQSKHTVSQGRQAVSRAKQAVC